MSEWSVCGMCNRVVYVNHLNDKGNCIYCIPITDADIAEVESGAESKVETAAQPELPGHTAPKEKRK